MGNLRAYLDGLNIRENVEERLVYQIVDLQTVKFNGLESGDIQPGDNIYMAIDNVINGFIWLHRKGLSFEKSIKDKLKEEELTYYIEFVKSFDVFNKFMQTNMHLTIK